MPAAAVIRGGQVLFRLTGRNELLGCSLTVKSKMSDNNSEQAFKTKNFGFI